MRRPRRAVLVAAATGLLSVLLAVVVNVATGGTLPAGLMRFAWLAWPLVGVLTLAVAVLAVLSVERAPASERPVPVTLPRDPGIVGRDGDLAAIGRAMADGSGVVVLAAAPGTGKTVLALHYAHRAAADFPDGRLFAALGGSSAEPVPPEEVLTTFLAGFGVPADERQGSVDDLAARFRAVVADRRVLVVLDDARSAAQVAPLLPGGRRCRVVVTARRALSDVPGAAVVPIGALPPDDAVRLLAAAVGDGRVTADPAGAARVVEACAGLPLALLIAGNRLRLRPGWTVGALADSLRDEAGRLAALTHSDTAIHATFRSAYDALPEADRLVFRRACSHPGRRFPVAAAAARCDVSEPRAAAALDRLTDLFLVDSPEPGRFGSHDLLRLFARGLLADDEQVGCTARLLDWQTRTAAPGRWLADERESVLLLLSDATAAGLDGAAWRLIEAVHPLLTAADEHVYRMRLWHLGDRIATGLGDDARRARAVRWIAHSYSMRGEAGRALDLSREALALVEPGGDRWEIAQSTRRLGESLRSLYRFDEAEVALRRALDLFVALGDTEEEIEVRSALGTLYNTVGRPDEALPMLERARHLLPTAEAGIHGWIRLGLAHAARLHGDDAAATVHLTAADAIAARIGDDFLAGFCRVDRARQATDPAAAAADLRAAREIFVGIENGTGVATADEELGQLAARRGDHREAVRLLGAAIDRYGRLGSPAREAGCRLLRATELDILGNTAAAAADRTRAAGLTLQGNQ